MRRILLNILLRIFFREQREIKKITSGEEFAMYRFKKEEDVVEILRHNRTCMTLWHFETDNQKEALIVKGMALMLNILLDAHDKALEIDKIDDDEKKLYYWTKYKKIENGKLFQNIKKVN